MIEAVRQNGDSPAVSSCPFCAGTGYLGLSICTWCKHATPEQQEGTSPRVDDEQPDGAGNGCRTKAERVDAEQLADAGDGCRIQTGSGEELAHAAQKHKVDNAIVLKHKAEDAIMLEDVKLQEKGSPT